MTVWKTNEERAAYEAGWNAAVARICDWIVWTARARGKETAPSVVKLVKAIRDMRFKDSLCS